MSAVEYAIRVAGSSQTIAESPLGGAVVLVGSGQPIKAFQVALKSMKQGEKVSLKIKPECKLQSTMRAPLATLSIDTLHACMLSLIIRPEPLLSGIVALALQLRLALA